MEFEREVLTPNTQELLSTLLQRINVLEKEKESLTRKVAQLNKKVGQLTYQLNSKNVLEIEPDTLDKYKKQALFYAKAIIKNDLTTEREGEEFTPYTEDEVNAYIQEKDSIIHGCINEMFDEISDNYEILYLFHKNDTDYICDLLRDYIADDLPEILQTW